MFSVFILNKVFSVHSACTVFSQFILSQQCFHISFCTTSVFTVQSAWPGHAYCTVSLLFILCVKAVVEKGPDPAAGCMFHLINETRTPTPLLTDRTTQNTQLSCVSLALLCSQTAPHKTCSCCQFGTPLFTEFTTQNMQLLSVWHSSAHS